MEHLTTSLKTYNSITNVLSAVKFYLRQRGASVASFSNVQVVCMLRALKATLLPPSHKVILSPAQFIRLMAKAKVYKQARHVIRLGLVLGFAGLLRRSNIAPETSGSFDATRHTTLGDLSVQGPNLVVHLKWTKTLQNSRGATVVLPVFKNGFLNPVTIFNNFVRVSPSRAPSAPLLIFPEGNLVTAPQLTIILQELVGSKGVTLHTLRRSGTTQAFLGGASNTQLAVQGTWVSPTFQRYIVNQATMQSPIQQAFTARFGS